MGLIRAPLRFAFQRAEMAFDSAFGPRLNPLTQLGTLGWLLFWVVAVSGIYVFAFFDTGITQAWQSLEQLSRGQWYLGGIMRSLHRYASDAMVLVVLLHALREFALDRMRGKRWFAWFTGVVLLWFLYTSGITGYWLVWDQLAQFVAVATTEWLDSIGIFAEPIARNFLDSSRLSGRFFTLMAYIHIAVPLLLLLLMWVHIQRHAQARVNPPRPLTLAVLAALLALSLLWPAQSQAPADLDRVPFTIGFDWFYFAVFPLLDRLDGRTLWAALVGGSLLLCLLSWLPKSRRVPAAQVDLDNCNGCARCAADCPYGAITMVQRTDGLSFEQQALVDADLCMSCGICVGACPTATPFRRASSLSAGIELPTRSVAGLREEIIGACAALRGTERVLVVGCAHDARSAALADERTAVVGLPCVAMLPPSFIDLLITRRHADGVLLSGCAEHDCYERLGDRWVEQRIAAERDPQLRSRVPRSRIGVAWNNPQRHARLRDTLAQFRSQLSQAPGTAAPAAPAAPAGPWRAPTPTPDSLPHRVAQFVALAAFAACIGFFATRPAYSYLGEDQALIKLSFIHAGQPLKPCRRYTHEELTNTPFAERRATDCVRGRWPVYIELDLDGRTVYRREHEPAGLWNDGPSSAYARFEVPAGRHELALRLRDNGAQEGFDYEASRTVDLAPGENYIVDFRGAGGGFVFGRPATSAATGAPP